jgi:hypothetical protein
VKEFRRPNKLKKNEKMHLSAEEEEKEENAP